MKPNTYCHSCLMPFKKDPGIRESDIYCSLCFNNGTLAYKGNDLKEFQKVVYQNMINRGTNKLLAIFYTFMIKFAPRWKQSKNS